MALKGFLLCAHGSLFVLLPAYVMFLLVRRVPNLDRTLIWWGAGGFLVATFPQNFFTILSREVLDAASVCYTAVAKLVVAALLAGLFLEGVKYLVLRYRRVGGEALVPSGVAVGLGAGLMNQIFQGFVLVGIGFRLLFGDISSPLAAERAASSISALGLAAVDSLLSRLSWLIVSACLGALIARAILVSKKSLLLEAMLLHAGIELIARAIALSLQGRGFLATLLALAFDCVLLAVGWAWLNRQLPQAVGALTHKKRRK